METVDLATAFSSVLETRRMRFNPNSTMAVSDTPIGCAAGTNFRNQFTAFATAAAHFRHVAPPQKAHWLWHSAQTNQQLLALYFVRVVRGGSSG